MIQNMYKEKFSVCNILWRSNRKINNKDSSSQQIPLRSTSCYEFLHTDILRIHIKLLVVVVSTKTTGYKMYLVTSHDSICELGLYSSVRICSL